MRQNTQSALRTQIVVENGQGALVFFGEKTDQKDLVGLINGVTTKPSKTSHSETQSQHLNQTTTNFLSTAHGMTRSEIQVISCSTH